MSSFSTQNNGQVQAIGNTSLPSREPMDQENQAKKDIFSQSFTNTTCFANGFGEDSPNNICTPFDFNKISILPKKNPVIQSKLSINTPGDKYEREADHIANRMMRT